MVRPCRDSFDVAWEGQTLRGESQPDDSTNTTTAPLAPPSTNIPGITTEPLRYNNAQITSPLQGKVAPVASTSGVSTPSGVSAPIFANPNLIARTITFNPFQPPDLISSSVPVNLTPLRAGDLWSLSFIGNSSLNYDSNITRNSGTALSDGYVHSGAGFNFRWGTSTEPVAFDLSYAYSADLFNRLHQFDTYTHDFSFSSRIGRSSFVLVPYVVGQFRSVESQDATASGRQSYNFLLAGAHGENSYFPNLVHTYDFSHTGIVYTQLNGANFEVWELSQQLDYILADRPTQPGLQSVKLFPWVDLKETTRTMAEPVDEISGGIGGAVTISRNLTLKGQVGWGDVSSNDRSVRYDTYSGLRYDTGVAFQPWRYLVLAVDYRRVLSFNPIVTSREIDELDFSLAAPLQIGPHLTLTPAIGVFARCPMIILLRRTLCIYNPRSQLVIL